MATITEAYTTTTFSKENSSSANDSFSSGLNCPGPIRNLSPIIIMNAPTEQQQQQQCLYLRREKMSDGEIGIFGAEKYFNGGMDEGSPKYQLKKDQERAAKLRVAPGTPSVGSALSHNSRSTLLQSIVLRNSSGRSKSSQGNGKGGFLANLGSCNCCCSSESAIDNIVVDESKIPKEPIKTSKDPFELTQKIDKMWVQDEEKGQKPLGGLEQQEEKAPSFERRFSSMFNWGAARKVEGSELPATSNDDTGSDASSDLFEIESLSGNLNPFLAWGTTSDCTTPTTVYAPSEASIAWSVVTASTADFSAMSDYEKPAVAATNPRRAASVRNMSVEAQRRRPSSLLGCKSRKAVSVAGSNNRGNERTNSVPSSFHRSQTLTHPHHRYR